MRLFDVDNTQQDDLVDSGQFTKSTKAGQSQVIDKYDDFKF